MSIVFAPVQIAGHVFAGQYDTDDITPDGILTRVAFGRNTADAIVRLSRAVYLGHTDQFQWTIENGSNGRYTTGSELLTCRDKGLGWAWTLVERTEDGRYLVGAGWAWRPARGFIIGRCLGTGMNGPIDNRAPYATDHEVKVHRNRAAAARWWISQSRYEGRATVMSIGALIAGVDGATEGDEYWSYQHASPSAITVEQYRELAALIRRAQRIIRAYEATVTWEMVPGSRIRWADNSVEETWVSSDGRTKKRMPVAPHGDLCF